MKPGNFTMKEALRFDPDLTINEIVAAYPETIPVFNEVGVDTCCGGGA
jgi:iron-sulfur cluster repair protein YtfE (RIC family)